jgi:hypothetical protein
MNKTVVACFLRNEKKEEMDKIVVACFFRNEKKRK